MFSRYRKTRVWSATLILISSALVGGATMAAPPTLESLVVSPGVRSLLVGQTQRYKATGTFSDGSAQALGAAISDIAPGYLGTCVLLTGGGVECWGYNGEGELGDGSTTDSLVARAVKWITTATAVATGDYHSCALLASGAVRCWGVNDYGQLGNDTSTSSTRPIRVTGIRAATGLAAGWAQSCALLAHGAVQCWGWNFYGQLGDGTNTDSRVAVSVTGISTATAVATVGGHTCALLSSGAVQCWGYNAFGQLGNGTTTNSNVPVTVRGISNATAVAVGGYFSCALLASGAVQCWGYGSNGELGNGAYANSSAPVSVAGIGTAVAITAGTYHACVVLRGGSASCWGYNKYGQLGDASTTATKSNTPVPVSEIGATVKLAAGKLHTCALLSEGAMRCWGFNNYGQLGNRRRTGETPHRWPVNVIGTPGVMWHSSDPSKASIGMRGMATAAAPGSTMITATTAGFIDDNAVLTVK